MYKLLIVDDEKTIRNGMREVLDWLSKDIYVVGMAKNGVEALEFIELFSPHIVITDINMPLKNGFDFIEEAKKISSYTKFIILSGYDDFNFAKRAIGVGVENYLLKPIDTDELKSTIDKIIEDFENSLSNDTFFIKRYSELNINLEKYYLAIKAGEFEKSQKHFFEVVNKSVMDGYSVLQFQKLCVQIVNVFIGLVKQDGYNLSETFLDKYINVEKEIIRINSYKELIFWIDEFNQQIIDWIKLKSKDSAGLAIKKSVDYIKENYDKQITVDEIASSVGLSNNYFSHLFKKSVGQSFTEYLNTIRIEKAKELLLEDTYKVYEVASKVGFSDYRYFSIVFKKQVGVSANKFVESSIKLN